MDWTGFAAWWGAATGSVSALFVGAQLLWNLDVDARAKQKLYREDLRPDIEELIRGYDQLLSGWVGYRSDSLQFQSFEATVEKVAKKSSDVVKPRSKNRNRAVFISKEVVRMGRKFHEDYDQLFSLGHRQEFRSEAPEIYSFWAGGNVTKDGFKRLVRDRLREGQEAAQQSLWEIDRYEQGLIARIWK